MLNYAVSVPRWIGAFCVSLMLFGAPLIFLGFSYHLMHHSVEVIVKGLNLANFYIMGIQLIGFSACLASFIRPLLHEWFIMDGIINRDENATLKSVDWAVGILYTFVAIMLLRSWLASDSLTDDEAILSLVFALCAGICDRVAGISSRPFLKLLQYNGNVDSTPKQSTVKASGVVTPKQNVSIKKLEDIKEKLSKMNLSQVATENDRRAYSNTLNGLRNEAKMLKNDNDNFSEFDFNALRADVINTIDTYLAQSKK